MKKMRKGFIFWVCIVALSLTIGGIALAAGGKGVYHFRGQCMKCDCSEFWCVSDKPSTCYYCGHSDFVHKH